MADVRLGLFGGFALDVDGVAVRLVDGGQRLVALLALQEHAARPCVGAVLWPDLSERSSLACLRTVLWRVNKTIPDVVQTSGSDLRLSSAVRLDVAQVADLASRFARPQGGGLSGAEVELIASSRSVLCAGPLLPGWYDDWVVEERNRLEQLRLHALEGCAERLLDVGETELALELALEAVHTEPLRETAAGTLMSVHVAEGNIWDAFREYESYRHRMLAELGLSPSQRLEHLLPAEWRGARDRTAAGDRRGSPTAGVVGTGGPGPRHLRR